MTENGRISELFMGGYILIAFAGPLRRTVPAIFQTVSEAGSLPRTGADVDGGHRNPRLIRPGSGCHRILS